MGSHTSNSNGFISTVSLGALQCVEPLEYERKLIPRNDRELECCVDCGSGSFSSVIRLDSALEIDGSKMDV